jgi:hypothetical protein
LGSSTQSKKPAYLCVNALDAHPLNEDPDVILSRAQSVEAVIAKRRTVWRRWRCEAFRQVADIQPADMLKLPVPNIESGKPRIVRAPATPQLKALVASLAVRAEKLKTMMRMLALAPEIQTYLAELRTPHAIWNFGYRPMGTLAHLLLGEQREKFPKMVADLESLQQRRAAGAGISTMVASVKSGSTPARVRIV